MMARKISELRIILNRPKQTNEILEEPFEKALHEQHRPMLNLLLLLVSAGLEIGFTVFLMALVLADPFLDFVKYRHSGSPGIFSGEK